MNCTRRNVEAHLYDASLNLVGIATNGLNPLRGSCPEGDCPRGLLTPKELPPDSPYGPGEGECLSPHAEIRLLRDAAPEHIQGGTLAVSTEPCHQCKVVIEDSTLLACVWPDGFWHTGTLFK